jgi:hypothetical protein
MFLATVGSEISRTTQQRMDAQLYRNNILARVPGTCAAKPATAYMGFITAYPHACMWSLAYRRYLSCLSYAVLYILEAILGYIVLQTLIELGFFHVAPM